MPLSVMCLYGDCRCLLQPVASVAVCGYLGSACNVLVRITASKDGSSSPRTPVVEHKGRVTRIWIDRVLHFQATVLGCTTVDSKCVTRV